MKNGIYASLVGRTHYDKDVSTCDIWALFTIQIGTSVKIYI
jgi:hypothetical protein